MSTASFDATAGGAPLSIEVDDRRSTLVLDGELDLSNVERLAGAIRQIAGPAGLAALDLRGLRFIDSSGIRLLLTEQRHLQSHQGDLVVVAASSNVRRVMELAGVWSVLAATEVGTG